MTTTTTAGLTYLTVAAALGITKGSDTEKTRAAMARLRALGYTKVCGRCGGSGEFSYNPMDGTMCFGCRGSKTVLVKLTTKLVTEAVARQAAGELDAYFAANKARTEAKRALRPLLATFDAEWSGGAVHTSHSNIRHTPSNTSYLVSAENFSATMVNSLHSAVHSLAYSSCTLTAEQKVAFVTDCIDKLREVNAAWLAYDGANRITPRV